MRLEISSGDVAAILAEAAASPDREVCGLLLGEGLRVDEVHSCRNVAEQPADSFEIDAVTLIAAHRAARNGGARVIGHYHSHPNGRAEPSERDTAMARTGEVWVIVAGTELTAWRAVDDQPFERLSL